jgi:hypothetical protein
MKKKTLYEEWQIKKRKLRSGKGFVLHNSKFYMVQSAQISSAKVTSAKTD